MRIASISMSELAPSSDSIHQPSNNQSLPILACNKDVLYRTLSYVGGPGSLYQTALVCRSWLHQSRVWLYKRATLDSSRKDKATQLAHTLDTNEYLRSLVREISILHKAEIDEIELRQIYTWLLSTRSDQILRLDLFFRKRGQQLLELILKCPFLENVKYLYVFIAQAREVEKIFSGFLHHFPAVQTVRCNVPVRCAVADQSRISSSITNLDVSLWSSSFVPLLNSLGESKVLTRLVLSIVDTAHIDLPLSSEKTLERIGENLITLSVQYSAAPLTQTHLVHHFLKRASRLRELECGESTYDAEKLFERFPKSIRGLKLYSDERVQFPFEAALAVAKSKGRGEIQLLQFTLIRQVEGDEPGSTEFRDACRDVGIDFIFNRVNLHNLNRRLMGMGNNMLGFNLGAYTNTSYKLYSYIDIQIQEVTTLELTKAVSTINSMAWKFPSYSPVSSMQE